MAEVSNLHPSHQQPLILQEHDENPSRIQTLASISNWYTNNNNLNGDTDFLFPFDFNPLSFYDSRSDSDSDSDSDYSGSLTSSMNFVTDLFESRDESLLSDPFGDSINNEIDFRVFEYDDFDLNHVGELGFGFESSVFPKDSSSNDLRIARIESDSDSDGQYEISRVSEDGSGRASDSDLPIFWTGTESEELDWEEVSGRVDDREGPSSVINRIEDISVSSDTYSEDEEEDEIGEEGVGDLEWEVLLAVNNLERNIEFFTNSETDDYVYATHHDTLFGHFLESESALKASPPAAKSVIENLPLVMLTKEELGKNNVVCAVCKDDILVEETVTRLPCCHHYHGDCIVPWLRIRNTCPVCRYELPTDDAEYERRKNGSSDLGLLDDLPVGYSFENLH